MTANSLTHDGTLFNFSQPEPDMVSLDGITHSMANIPRWNGHMQRYSFTLMDHSILVCVLLYVTMAGGHKAARWSLSRDETALLQSALLHDSSEAYTGDMPGPLKKLIRGPYKAVENPIEAVIARKFGAPYPWAKAIKIHDILAQDIECVIGFHDSPNRASILTPGFEIKPWQDRLFHELRTTEGNKRENKAFFMKLHEALSPEGWAPRLSADLIGGILNQTGLTIQEAEAQALDVHKRTEAYLALETLTAPVSEDVLLNLNPPVT